MRILVVGAGSTGGYFGGRLAQAGRDVTFLVRPQRAELLKASGLQIKSPRGDVTLTPQLVTAGNIAAPFDTVLLTVKAFSLERALDDFAPAVGPETMILPVLNGMKHVGILTARFGEKAVVGCVCKVAAVLDDQGRIVQLAEFHDLVYGEMNGAPSRRTDQLDAVMQGAIFNARLSPTIEREMWEKWILLAALGGITCLMRGNVGEIEAAPGGVDFVHRFLDEIVSVVTAVGKPPTDAFLTHAREVLTARSSTLTSSMYRDLQKGSAIEADQIIGDLLDYARRAHVPTPLLAAAYTHLSIYQSRESS
jgi:2-dehydropantoate 2-reductase